VLYRRPRRSPSLFPLTVLLELRLILAALSVFWPLVRL
jgi:hypothetical protein